MGVLGQIESEVSAYTAIQRHLRPRYSDRINPALVGVCPYLGMREVPAESKLSSFCDYAICLPFLECDYGSFLLQAAEFSTSNPHTLPFSFAA